MADLYTRRERPKGYKIMWYTNVQQLNLPIFEEFRRLWDENYTHAVDMPGQFREIRRISKNFEIVCMNKRMPKNIADMCSKTMWKNNLTDMSEWRKHLKPPEEKEASKKL